MNQRNLYLQALLCGGLLALAFAPLNWWILAFVSPAWLYHLISQQPPKRSFLLGYYFGLGFFGVGVSWIYVSIHVYGGAPIFLAMFFTAGFIAFLALYYGLITWLTRSLSFKGWGQCLGFASLWVLQELLRSWLFTGFPWLLLGYTQIDSPLQGLAPLIGVYGLSFCVLCLSLILWALSQKSSKLKQRMLYFAIFVGVVSPAQFLREYAWTQIDTEPQRVQIIQANVKPFEKFVMQNPMQGALDTYGKLMFANAPANFIIWPENGISLPLPDAKPLIRELEHWAKTANTTLLVGIPIQALNNSEHYYNSILALGQGSGVYHKQHLVPFGEYVPFEKYLRGLISFFDLPMSSFIKGPHTQPLKTPHSQLLPLICYEIAYPDYVRKQLMIQNANVIVTLSEDGWFGRSLGPHQHLQITRMRALETGRYIIRSTPTGISAIISPTGQIIEKTPQYEAAILEGHWFNASDFTPYTYLSIYWMIAFQLGLLLMAYCWPFKPNKSMKCSVDVATHHTIEMR